MVTTVDSLGNFKQQIADKLKNLLKTAKKNKITSQSLANSLGVAQRTVQNWMDRSLGHDLPAYAVPKICELLDDYTLLEDLEENVGRVSFRLPSTDSLNAGDFEAVQQLIKEVGITLQSFSETLKDGKVDDEELPKTNKALGNLIKECARLQQWLVEHHDRDKTPSDKA